MANPTKPTTVKLADLKAVLAQLQQLQGKIQEGRPGSWDSIGSGSEVTEALKGMQENVASEWGQYYGDISTHTKNSWTSLQGGVTTLISMVQQTINAHGNTETTNADGAKNTNTGTAPSAGSSQG